MDRLRDTPVTSFGLNFDLCREVPGVNVGVALGEFVEKMGLAQRGERTVTGTISFGRKVKLTDMALPIELTVSAVVGPSAVGTSFALVRHNFDFRILPTEQKFFNLSEMLGAQVKKVQRESHDQLERSVAVLARRSS
jgi:hypothetical protein